MKFDVRHRSWPIVGRAGKSGATTAHLFLLIALKLSRLVEPLLVIGHEYFDYLTQRRGIAWKFTSRDAQRKLERLYPVKETEAV